VALRGRPLVARLVANNPQQPPMVSAVHESDAPPAARPPARSGAHLTALPPPAAFVVAAANGAPVKWRRCFFCALSATGSFARRAGKNELICVVNCGGQMANPARRGRPPLTLADAQFAADAVCRAASARLQQNMAHLRAAQLRAAQPRAAQPRAPQPRAPQPRAEQPRAPQPRAPQPRAPQPRAPQLRAPQPRAPQHAEQSAAHFATARAGSVQRAQHSASHFGTERTALPAKIYRLDDGAPCAVCLDAPPACVFAPCGHAVVCATCVTRIDGTCPLCRAHIRSAQPLCVASPPNP
jgi:hypothetical protein